MAKSKVKPPICPHCNNPAVLVTGRDIYPHRRDLWEKNIWLCRKDQAYVGCHPGSKRSLGTPANADLRTARMKLHHLRLDPIWKNAPSCGLYSPEDGRAVKVIQNAARTRTYAFLAEGLGIDAKDCHTGMFDIEMCRRAWTLLFKVTYPQIRDWHNARKAAQEGTKDGRNDTDGRSQEKTATSVDLFAKGHRGDVGDGEHAAGTEGLGGAGVEHGLSQDG